MLKKSSLVLLLLAAAPGLQAAALTAQGVEDRIIVAFKPGVGSAEARLLAQARGLEIIDEIDGAGVLLVKAKPGKAAAAFMALNADPKVYRADPDAWMKWIESEPATFQSAPLPSVESVLGGLRQQLPPAPSRGRAQDGEAQWGVARVNAPAVWGSNQGEGVKVAVVDTGIDPEHPELKGKISGGHNSLDKNGSWADDHFHGTHVAGIIAAALDGKGVVGVAPKATLIAVKVLSKEGSGSLFSIMDGIIWSAQNGANVINMSLGANQEMPLIQYALQMAKNAGVTQVCAAGNGDGNGGPAPVGYPAAYPECIAISALDQADGITKWSSRGPQVAFIAPGFKIPSTVPTSHDPSGVKAYSGTSMATPHVAGLAALAVARGVKGPDAVRAALTAAAVKVPNLSASEQGAGVIDAARITKRRR